jgi:hypothetical protein
MAVTLRPLSSIIYLLYGLPPGASSLICPKGLIPSEWLFFAHLGDLFAIDGNVQNKTFSS